MSKRPLSIRNQELRDKWKSRRLMTWIVFWSLIGSYFFGLLRIEPDKLDLYTSLYATFFTFGTAVIAAYFGFATYHDVSNDTKNVEGSQKVPDEENS